jgi:hypothetical protein
MYVAEIPGGLRNWGSGSQCRHAVAATIDGPYEPKDLVLGPECHNPSTLRHPKTGLYVCDSSYVRARVREVCFARALVLPCACLSTWLLRRWHTQLVSPPLASTRVRVCVRVVAIPVPTFCVGGCTRWIHSKPQTQTLFSKVRNVSHRRRPERQHATKVWVLAHGYFARGTVDTRTHVTTQRVQQPCSRLPPEWNSVRGVQPPRHHVRGQRLGRVLVAQ